MMMRVRPVPMAMITRRPFAAGAATTAVPGANSETRKGSPQTAKWAAVFAAGASLGFWVGREDLSMRQRVLPTPRTCCEAPPATEELIKALEAVVGSGHVIAAGNSQAPFVTGARITAGVPASAVVQPGTLAEAVEALKVCMASNVAVLPQGSNTGLTGGSVPTCKSRPTVVISMKRLSRVTPIAGGGDANGRVVCLSGAGILDINAALEGKNRESHSLLGSTLNPSVAGGVAFGSGGTQIRKGPAYTERALYCIVAKDGTVEVVDNMGLKSDSQADLFKRIESGEGLQSTEQGEQIPASFPGYRDHLCKIDGQPSRFNADTSGPAPNRCEGKVLILAQVHETYPVAAKSQRLWIACTDFASIQKFRTVALADPVDVPRSMEYMDRDCFDVVDRAGRPLIAFLRFLGQGPLAFTWAVKVRIDALPLPFVKGAIDRLMYLFNPILPKGLPSHLQEVGRKFDHHILVECADFGNGELKRLEGRLRAVAEEAPAGTVEIHAVDSKRDVALIDLFRFACAPAFMTAVIGRGVQGLSLDYALPKNELGVPTLPDDVKPLTRMRYAHLACNVVHEDLMFANDVDVHEMKLKIKSVVEGVGGFLPAEHGHGTEYHAPKTAQERWMKFDPGNHMNPGVGGLSDKRDYK